jgi:peptidoglycan/xylan/chitin deacetylase (PgdA/CDA1 family)
MSDRTSEQGFTFPASHIPYPERKGLSIWPNDARLAVLLYTAPEQWQWGISEKMDPSALWRHGEPLISLSTRSAVEYGFNVGLYRMRDTWAEFGMKASLISNGNAVEQFREVMTLLAGDGHELVAHGYSEGVPMVLMDRAEQAEAIRLSIELLTTVTGKAPTGWLSPGAKANQDTIELVAEAGLTYSADLQADEIPYFIYVGDKRLVVVPYRMVGNLNDYLLFTTLGRPRSVTELSSYLIESFDASYAAAATTPMLFNFGTHPYVSGRPDGMEAQRRLLDHISNHDDVWVTTYSEVAEWFDAQFGHLAPDGGGKIDVSALVAS